jgi:hypothetical protein
MEFGPCFLWRLGKLGGSIRLSAAVAVAEQSASFAASGADRGRYLCSVQESAALTILGILVYRVPILCRD